MVRGADEIRERIAEMLREEYFGEEERAHATALLAAAEYGRDPVRIVEETGLNAELVAGVVRNLETSDFWKFDTAAGCVRPQTAHWDEPPPAGAIAFGLWLLVAQGIVFTQGESAEDGPKFVQPDAFFDRHELVDDGE